MESNVVQLARFNTTNFASNTEWTTTLKQPIILEQGDTAVVSKSYLDTRLNSGGNIVIPQDLDLSLTFYFYQMFPPDGTSLETQDGSPPISAPNFPAPMVNNTPVAGLAVPTAQSTINPNDLILWATPFTFGPSYDPDDQEFLPGIWFPYQKGFATPPEGSLYQYLNDGVPVPPYARFNSPPFPPYVKIGNIPDDKINQCYAKEIPLLLTSVANGNHDPVEIGDSSPYTKVWTYTLKAGSYAPDQLAEILTRAMSQIQPVGDEEPSYTAYDQYGTSLNPPKLNAFMAKGQYIFESSSTPDPALSPFPPYYDAIPAGMTYATNDVNNINYPQYNYTLNTFLTDAFIPPAYLEGVNGITDYNNPLIFQQTKLATAYSNTIAFGTNPAVTYTLTNYCSPVIGCSQPEILFNDQAGVFQFAYTHTPLLELPTGGGVLGENTGTNPIEVVKIIKTNNIVFEPPAPPTASYFSSGQSNICEHTKHSGIIFKAMEPKSFWGTILGFDVDNLCIAESDIWGPNRTMTYQKFKDVTTSGFVGLSNNFNFVNVGAGIDPTTNNMNQPPYMGPSPIYATKSGGNTSQTGELTYTNLLNSARWFGEQFLMQNNSFFNNGGTYADNPSVYEFPYSDFLPYYYEEYASALTATNPITAISPPLSNVENVGHYLVEIVAYGGDKEFINTNTIYQIKNIVSSYYNSSGSFQSSPFPDSYVYSHTGETQIIHSFKVRIIDPYTMDTATNIGPSSSIYVQFNKPVTQTLTQQVS